MVWVTSIYIPRDLLILIADLFLFFYRVKLWNVADTQTSLQVLTISTMKCGTHRAAKYSIVITSQTGKRGIIVCPKRRKGRN